MKIALIAPTHIPARRANTFQVMKMAEALQENGQQVALIIPGLPEGGKPGWEELRAHYGLSTPFELAWLPARARFKRHDFALHALQYARAWGAELIYTRLPQAAALASLLGRAVILEVHDLPQGPLGSRMLGWFLRGRGKKLLVVISAQLKADLTQQFPLANYPDLCLLAADGVDLRRFEALPPAAGVRMALGERFPLLAERFTAGYTGHLYAGRGIELILGMAGRLPEINFLLVGGNPEDVQRYRDLARQRSLANVHLAGFIANAELPTWQAASDVLLMPYQAQVSASSGGDIGRYLSPMKLFEYMASGRAILSSNLPVLQEVLNPQNAVLLDPTDMEAWVQALGQVCEQAALREKLAMQARLDVEAYTWQRRAARILAAAQKN